MHQKVLKKIWKQIFCPETPVLLFFVGMTFCMLSFGSLSSGLALEGLHLWFNRMVPALLPFMILSGTLIGTGLSDRFASLFSPVLRPLFHLSDSCQYCIVIGFLCGFPMGARICSQSYEKGKLTRREATLLLAFCNNIGPVYFTGYVLTLFAVEQKGLALFGMYGIPLLYGLLLRCTIFRQIPEKPVSSDKTEARLSAGKLLTGLHDAILSALNAITVLGGYMIFCNLLNLIPRIFLKGSPTLISLAGLLLEITSGLSRLSSTQKAWAFIALPFGGLSCIAQTWSCIRNTDLSLSEYVFHKLVQTMLTAAFYAVFPLS